MSLLQTNATVSVLRATYNPATKQTSSQAVVPEDIALAAQMLVAHWLEFNLDPGRFEGANGVRMIPAEAAAIIQGYRRLLF